MDWTPSCRISLDGKWVFFPLSSLVVWNGTWGCVPGRVILSRDFSEGFGVCSPTMGVRLERPDWVRVRPWTSRFRVPISPSPGSLIQGPRRCSNTTEITRVQDLKWPRPDRCRYSVRVDGPLDQGEEGPVDSIWRDSDGVSVQLGSPGPEVWWGSWPGCSFYLVLFSRCFVGPLVITLLSLHMNR